MKAECSDPLSCLMMEEKISKMKVEVKNVQAENVRKARKLQQQIKKVEVLQGQVDERTPRRSGESIEAYEEYIHRLKDVEAQAQLLAERRVTVTKTMQMEWARWLELLTSSARTLR